MRQKFAVVISSGTLFAVRFLISIPLTSAVQAPPLPQPTDLGGFIGLICRIAGWMFGFLVVLSVIFVLVAAYIYMTAGGDAERVKSAHRMIAYTAVAILVAIVARSTPRIVFSIFGTNFQSIQGAQSCT